MKSKVAMAVSIAGVLVAGSAAALVNTQVLDSSASPTSFSIDAASQNQSTTSTVVATIAPTITAASVVPAPNVTQPTVTQPTDLTTTLPVAATPATQVVYAIGTAGSVTLDTAGDVLSIVAVDPAGGWVVTKSETEDTNNVEVRLESGDGKAEFHANLLFGVITTSIETDDRSGNSGSGSNSGTGSSGSGSSGSGSSGHGGGGDDD